jgi:hypothetical protein
MPNPNPNPGEGDAGAICDEEADDVATQHAELMAAMALATHSPRNERE